MAKYNDNPVQTLIYRSIEKNYNDPRNVNSKICSECGGQCCKRCGCYFSPDDFKTISFEFLKQVIGKGFISIEYINGSTIYDNYEAYILRVRNKGAPIVDNNMQKSSCILLEDDSCKLDYERRPSGGKLLMPSRNFYKIYGRNERSCHSNYTMENCCYEWEPYQKILSDLAEYFEGKDIPCSI